MTFDPPARGSSPRARGTLTNGTTATLSNRFIPACAGNACARAGRKARASVHPRVRGERCHSNKRRQTSHGSSPRARGTLGVSPATICRWRFIPACAGNASRVHVLGRRPPVHPRVRGERLVAQVSLLDGSGSSPRARGTPNLKALDISGLRFIPACAGNANGAEVAATSLPVHPRVRGERVRDVLRCRSAGGSSPRARGTLPAVVLGMLGQRFIPACAGNARTAYPNRSW